MSRKLDDLSERFKPLAMELIARCVEQRIDVLIIDTLRTVEEQKVLMQKGVSWTMNSKHLTGDAIDLAVKECIELKNWAPNHPDWLAIGEIGENLGLEWGGRWTVKDMCHFQFPS